MFTCPKCFEQFPKSRDLERHLQRKIPCDADDHKCNGCAHSFTSKKGLKAHIDNNRCKGKRSALVAHEATQELENLQQRMQQQEQLLHMTNSVTAAASSVTNNIGTQHNHITINIQNVVSSVGREKISHFSQLSDTDMLSKLTLLKCPKAMADWCALLRADESHPENHNALLLAADSKEMACCRAGIWSWDETEKILLEISRSDITRLYNHLGRYEQDAAAQEFRQEYLVHDLMTRASNSDVEKTLKPIMDAIAKPIIALTQKFYATTIEDSKDTEDVELQQEIDNVKEAMVDARAAFAKTEAAQVSLLMSLQRRMAERAKRRSEPANK